MNLQGMYDEAIAFQQNGRLTEAEPLYCQILAFEPHHVMAQHMLANIRAGQGRNFEALELLRAALKINPSDPAILRDCGKVLHELGRYQEALVEFDQALTIEPDHASALNNRGSTLHNLKRWKEALECYDRAITIRPDFTQALYNRGNTLYNLKRLEEALESYDRALVIYPDYMEALNNRGNVLRDLKRLDEALASYDKALAIQPDYVLALSNRANVLGDLKRLDEALICYDKTLSIQPDYVLALNNRGNVLQDMGRFDEALASHDKAVSVKPDYVQAIHDGATALWRLARFEESLARYDKALAIEPNDAEAHKNRAGALRELGRIEEAVQSLDRATALDPKYAEAYLRKAVCKFLSEDLEEGWQLYEWRKRLPVPIDFRTYAQPLWSVKEDIAGKTLFLYTEQGLGDTIQFFRYAVLARARNARVIVSVQDALVRLLDRASQGVEVVNSSVIPQEFDYHLPLMSLPMVFGTKMDNIPAHVPYLKAEPDRVKSWAHRLGHHGFKVGICWQGSPLFKIDFGRSIALSHFDRLSKIPGVRLISLQKGAGTAQLLNLPPGMKVESLGDGFDEGPHAFLDSAAVMEHLDLIITSDTSVAHLAGALGRPTWVALKFIPEWRWFLGRSDSPWYPTMRLFRQSSVGEWPAVFAEMEAQLVQLAKAK